MFIEMYVCLFCLFVCLFVLTYLSLVLQHARQSFLFFKSIWLLCAVHMTCIMIKLRNFTHVTNHVAFCCAGERMVGGETRQHPGIAMFSARHPVGRGRPLEARGHAPTRPTGAGEKGLPESCTFCTP